MQQIRVVFFQSHLHVSGGYCNHSDVVQKKKLVSVLTKARGSAKNSTDSAYPIIHD